MSCHVLAAVAGLVQAHLGRTGRREASAVDRRRAVPRDRGADQDVPGVVGVDRHRGDGPVQREVLAVGEGLHLPEAPGPVGGLVEAEARLGVRGSVGLTGADVEPAVVRRPVEGADRGRRDAGADVGPGRVRRQRVAGLPETTAGGAGVQDAATRPAGASGHQRGGATGDERRGARVGGLLDLDAAVGAGRGPGRDGRGARGARGLALHRTTLGGRRTAPGLAEGACRALLLGGGDRLAGQGALVVGLLRGPVLDLAAGLATALRQLLGDEGEGKPVVTECWMLLQRLPHLVRAGSLSFAFGFALAVRPGHGVCAGADRHDGDDGDAGNDDASTFTQRQGRLLGAATSSAEPGRLAWNL